MGREIQGSQAGEKKLERYGVWIKVEPREVADFPETEGSVELMDLESPKATGSTASDGTLTVEEEKLLDELDTELGPSDNASNLSIPEEEPLLADEEELPDISTAGELSAAAPADSDEELPELELEEETLETEPAQPQKARAGAEAGEVEVHLSESTEQDRFEDLDALEDELATAASSASQPGAASSEILTRIEDELRSIRSDLTELRNELSGLRKGAAEVAVETPRAGTEAQGGFFDEDEDETIALTGDELDNILNTAEITEEPAEAAVVEEPEMELESVEDDDSQRADVLSLDAPIVLEEEPETEQPAEQVEELPAELVLEDLGSSEASTPAEAGAEALPELDLEGIPEIETAPGSEKAEEADKIEELETLELEEEPTEVEAAPEAAEALDLELVEEPAAGSAPAAAEEPAADVDLEALAAEADALEKGHADAPIEDLEIGELEAVTEEPQPEATGSEEIEIEFEGEPAASAPAEPEAEEALLEPMEDIPEAEEIPEVEEVPAMPPAPAEEKAPAPKAQPKEGAAAIPEDLKDEIRTVLKYMDHLLEALPDEKIQEFASSDYFVMYKKLFEDLGLGE